MNVLRLFVNGFLIGIANIIPGMSGGTLALVLGIYERLIAALRNIGTSTVKRLISIFTFKQTALSDFRDELRRIDFSFLMILGIGAVVAVLVSSKLIVYLLKSHHDATYGFFFGLVLTSILIPLRMLKGFSWRELLGLIAAIALIVFAEELKKSAAGSTSVSGDGLEVSIGALAIFFGCGALAISAMILPGVSGSFLLLAFGVYFPLVTAIKNFMDDVPTLLKGDVSPAILSNGLILTFFTLGCLFGLLAFTRLLNFLLARYRNLTIAFLIGLMVGSLYGLWPFRESETVGDKYYDTAHLLPQLDMNLLITLCVFLVGCGIILGFSRLEKETG
jgi:putative membrane protein